MSQSKAGSETKALARRNRGRPGVGSGRSILATGLWWESKTSFKCLDTTQLESRGENKTAGQTNKHFLVLFSRSA